MVIENRDAVVAGTKLVATYKKQQYICAVEAGEDGKLAFVYDGKRYSSPSSAGTAVIGTACNGWRVSLSRTVKTWMVFSAAEKRSNLPLLSGRFEQKYICAPLRKR